VSAAVPNRNRRESYWPPDDTEESVAGTDLHQKTTTNLRLGINECAELARQPDRPAPWQALSQIVLLGGRSRDRDDYRTMPDVFVYKRAIDLNRGSLTLSVDGPPALIIEVLSESTYATDIDLERGKGYTYAQAGVPEYLTIDPTGAFLPEGIRAWRLIGGIYHPWLPAANGRWQSEEIGIAIGLEGAMATIHTADGRRQLREGEIARELVRKDAELSHKDVQLSRKDAELSRKDLELAELRRLVEELRKK
jgi:Uma2 family endonuclease